MSKNIKNFGLPWHEVEKSIYNEIIWLKKVIDATEENPRLTGYDDKLSHEASSYYFYRQIAILIVSGQLKTTEIKSNNLWGGNNYLSSIAHRHGKEWHRETMDRIDAYFRSQGYDVVTEPNLHHGRADLGIYMKNKKDLYVEVGSTSIYKLWLNLNAMDNFILLVIPFDNIAIEFEK